MFPLLLASTLVSAACVGTPKVLSAPPAVLTDALALRHPNGISVGTVTLTPDATGTVLAVHSDAPGAMQQVVQTWGKGVTVAARSPKCGALPMDLNNVDFFPPSSGVVGRPRVVDGVDFDNFIYASAPGDCKRVTLVNGLATAPPDPDNDYEASIQDVFAGKVSGIPTAVVVLRCEYNGHGFAMDAQVFRIDSHVATKMGSLGSGGMIASDSEFPNWPGGYIHVSFKDGLLYADVWDSSNQCKRNADWISTSYAIRDGKLVAMSSTHHHRAGLDVFCGFPQ